MSTLSNAFLTTWAAEYEDGMPDVETRLFTETGPAARARGHLEADEFATIAAWKTPRSKSRIATNADDDVREVTALALAGPERLQHRVLTLLAGVQVPTATALLAVVFRDRHTILDVRSAKALARLDAWDGRPGYTAYLTVCRPLAARLKVDLRTLDRALWRWSKAGYPE